MKSKKLNEKLMILIPILIILVVSIFDMYSAKYVSSLYTNTYKRQILWILVGIVTFVIIYKIDIRFILKYINYIYIIGILSLILVLFFGININGASSWFRVGSISIQPSELFKPFFIIFLSNLINKHKSSDIKLLLKILVFTLIPCILIFLEPDTGVVLMYILIMIGSLIASKIDKRYVISLFIIITLSLLIFLGLYFTNSELFIKLFGTSFFYRMDRLLSFKNNSSYQLNNALIGIGSSGIFGYGIDNPKIYVPELTTDFAFDLTIISFGYILGIILVILYTFILFRILHNSHKTNKYFNKLILSSIFYLMLFQTYEHILMNIGLVPITGITLPFLSYGGSSMISYFIILALIIKII